MAHPFFETVKHSASYARLLISRSHPLPRKLERDPALTTAVLLVPGFLGTRDVLSPLGQRFERMGIPAFSLHSGLYSLLPFAENRRLLIQRVYGIRLRFPKLTELYIVAHSMGGLVALEAIDDGAFDDIAIHVVTLGTPFRGTWSALLGCPFAPSAYELVPIHPRYRREPSISRRKLRFLSIAGRYDALAPHGRCVHPAAERLVLPTDHAGLLLRKDVFHAVHRFLTHR